MNSEPTIAALLEADPTLTWDAFRARLGAVATQEELQSVGDDAENRTSLAVADTATFGVLPFRKEDWMAFVGSANEDNTALPGEALEAIFNIAQRAGIIASAEASDAAVVPTHYVIPSTVVQQRLEDFLKDLP